MQGQSARMSFQSAVNLIFNHPLLAMLRRNRDIAVRERRREVLYCGVGV
jgi:hypothetical protein